MAAWTFPRLNARRSSGRTALCRCLCFPLSCAFSCVLVSLTCSLPPSDLLLSSRLFPPHLFRVLPISSPILRLFFFAQSLSIPVLVFVRACSSHLSYCGTRLFLYVLSIFGILCYFWWFSIVCPVNRLSVLIPGLSLDTVRQVNLALETWVQSPLQEAHIFWHLIAYQCVRKYSNWSVISKLYFLISILNHT